MEINGNAATAGLVLTSEGRLAGQAFHVNVTTGRLWRASGWLRLRSWSNVGLPRGNHRSRGIGQEGSVPACGSFRSIGNGRPSLTLGEGGAIILTNGWRPWQAGQGRKGQHLA